MEFTAEEQEERKRIERESGRELRGLQPACREMFLPLAKALVVVRQRDAVGAVAYPVHGAQGCVVEGILTQVVFQDDMGAADTRGFAEELPDVRGVVQHVNEEANVKGLIGKRKL